MSRFAASWLGRRGLILWMFVAALGGGCSPDAFLVADEDRERNFQRARESERLGDYEGAAEFYERVIEKNPRSAAVHLGYASLCEGSLRRHADAVYHYQRYLKLRGGDPKDAKAESIRRRITNCTEQLATSVPLVIRSDTIARELSSVRGENRVLRLQVTNLVAGLAHWSNEWARASQQLAQALASGGAGTPEGGTVRGGGSSSGPGNVERSASTRSPADAGRSVRGATAGSRGSAFRGTAAFRTHRVGPGETMEGVARRYGIPSSSLMRANPSVRPRTMRVGTILRIPDR